MKSQKLHNLLPSMCFLLLFAVNASSKPLSIESKTQLEERPVILVKHNVGVENIENYQIVHDPKGEPCLTISWKTNPDGSGPGYPQIYMAKEYFNIRQ